MAKQKKEAEDQEGNLENIIEISETQTLWDDIGGCIDAKKQLQRLSLEIMHPEISERWGGKPPRGILLYGPQGTGKTLLAKAFSTSTDAELWKIKGTDIGSKFVNESANNVKKIFEAAKQTVLDTQTNVIIFIDEFDSIARKRSSSEGAGSQEDAKVVNALNVYLDGLDTIDGIYILASTNRLDILDPSIIRPGRFDRHIEVGNPNYDERIEIYQIHTKLIEEEAKITAFEDNIDYEILSELSEKTIDGDTIGFSGAEIAEIVKRSRNSKKWYEYETGKNANPINTKDIIKEIKNYLPKKDKTEQFGFARGVKKKK